MSPQACVVCTSPKRDEIDSALAGGEAGRSVARRYELTEASVRRHRANHLGVPRVETLSSAGDAGMNPGPGSGEERETVPETFATVARRRFEEEVAQRERDRISTIERELQETAARERREAEREAARQAALERVEELEAEIARGVDGIWEALGPVTQKIVALRDRERQQSAIRNEFGFPGRYDVPRSKSLVSDLVDEIEKAAFRRNPRETPRAG